MAKIDKKTIESQVKTKVFYIDSAKFLIDSNFFSSIKIPNNIIELDGDTGEQLREFKRKSLQVQYKNQHIYIANYTKILKEKRYDKFVIMFSAKVSEHYLSGIRKSDFIEVLEHLKTLGYVGYEDDKLTSIVNEFYTKDTDIAYNIIVPTIEVPKIIEQWKFIRNNSENKEKIRVGNRQRNQMIQFGKRGDQYFFKIYNKSLEIKKDAEEFNLLPITPDERKFFLSRDFTMLRIEITIRNKKDFEALNTSSKLVDLWATLNNNNKSFAKLVRKYYDAMTGNYQPKIRKFGKLSPTDKGLLVLLLRLKKEDYSYNKMIDETLSLFESNTNAERKAKSRFKAKIETLIDYLYLNEDSIKEQHKRNTEAYKYIEEMFFLAS